MNMEEAREALAAAFPGRLFDLRQIVTTFEDGTHDTNYYLRILSRPGKMELIDAGAVDLARLVVNAITEHAEAKP